MGITILTSFLLSSKNNPDGGNKHLFSSQIVKKFSGDRAVKVVFSHGDNNRNRNSRLQRNRNHIVTSKNVQVVLSKQADAFSGGQRSNDWFDASSPKNMRMNSGLKKTFAPADCSVYSGYSSGNTGKHSSGIDPCSDGSKD